MLTWPARLPVALVSSIFACLDVGSHAALRRCERQLLAISRLASSSPHVIALRVTEQNAEMGRVSGYRPRHLHLNVVVPISTIHWISMTQLSFAPHLVSLHVTTIGLQILPPVEIPSFAHFSKLATFIYTGFGASQRLVSQISVAPNLTHLDVSQLSLRECLRLPVSLRVLRLPILLCSDADDADDTAKEWGSHLTRMTQLEHLELGTGRTFERTYSLSDIAHNMPRLRVLKVMTCEAPTEPLPFVSLTELSCGFARPGTVDEWKNGDRLATAGSAYRYILDINTLEVWDFHKDVADSLKMVNNRAATHLSYALGTRVRPTNLTYLRLRRIHHSDLEGRLCRTSIAIRTLRFVCDDARNFQCLSQLASLQHLHIHGCVAIELGMSMSMFKSDDDDDDDDAEGESVMSQLWPPLPSLRSLTIHKSLTTSNLAKLAAHYPHVDMSGSVPHDRNFLSI
jgi:hypothetical protein